MLTYDLVARQVLSKHWQHRSEGLDEIRKQLTAQQDEQTKENVSKSARLVAGLL
jgi:Zn-finger protein